MVTRYACGHVGKVAGKKVKRFIRVAEIRRQPVEESKKQCPECKTEDAR
jgi:hypothetical protein